MAYIGNCVSPFFYGQGNSVNGTIVQTIPPSGVPEQPIVLNQTFWIRKKDFYVPEIFGDVKGFLVNFVSSGTNHFQKQWLIDIPGANSTIDDCLLFFNRNPEDSSIIDGVLKTLIGSFGDNLSSIVYLTDPENFLLSKRGEYTIEQHYFPWPNATSPVPSRNDNGTQRGSIIRFFANDGSYLISFDLPQDLRTKLNTFPV